MAPKIGELIHCTCNHLRYVKAIFFSVSRVQSQSRVLLDGKMDF